jgi:sugar phosphate isomerase/epimerase
MRLGGPVALPESGDPGEWIARHKDLGYGAAIFPLNHTAAAGVVRECVTAAREAGVVIGEVGAWSNPIATDEDQRRAAIAYCQAQLALADEVGARCCVNIAGSRSPEWAGPHPDNLSEDTFALIVETTRAIIDAVQPTRTFFTLEAMPWIFPDSPESYMRLIDAIDRQRFAVHLDPVNMVNNPERCFRNGEFLRECFRLLGPYVRSCHAKDTRLSTLLTVHIDEVQPGLGTLDYATFLRELDRLDPDTTLIMEHLQTPAEYAAAANYIRQVADREGLAFVGG